MCNKPKNRGKEREMMRKLIKLGLIVVMLASFNAIQTPLEVSGETEVIVMEFKIGVKDYTINGITHNDMEEAPRIEFGRTFMPIRPIVENLPGVEIEWDGNTNTVTITNDDPELIMKIFVNDYVCPDNMRGKISIDQGVCEMVEDNDYIALVNGEEYYIESEQMQVQNQVKPFISGDGTTMLPLRFIGEWLGAFINWDTGTSTATLTFIKEAKITSFDFNIYNKDPYSRDSNYSFFDSDIISDDGDQMTVINSTPYYTEAYREGEYGSKVHRISSDVNTDFEVPYFEYYFTPPAGEIISNINIDDQSETTTVFKDLIAVVNLDFPITNGGDLIESYPLYDLMSASNIQFNNEVSFYKHFIGKCIDEYDLERFKMNLDIRCLSTPGDERIRILVPTIKSITFSGDGGFIIEYYNGDFKLNIETVEAVYKNIVDYPCNCESFQESSILNNQPKSMLIITHENFIGTVDDKFDDLADYEQWRTSVGVKTDIIPLSKIPDYGKIETETAIRNYIKYVYNNTGLDYVLLVGDTDTIPSFKRLHKQEYWCDPVYSNINSEMYTDTPYGNCGAYWNDYILEVAVGRIPANNIQDLRNYMNKARLYNDFIGNRNRILFSSGVLFDTSREYKGGYVYNAKNEDTVMDDLPVKDGRDMIEIINEWVPELENTYEINIIDSCCENACMDRVYSAISSFNPDIINFGYHSTTMISGGLDGKAICNDHPSLFYNIGCFSNNFGGSTGWTKKMAKEKKPYDNEVVFDKRCFSESVLFSECNNCAGYIGNSSFGFYRPWHRQRQSSLEFQIEFFKELLGDDDMTIGEAFKRSKNNMYVYCIDEINEAYRWVFDGLNLLGDPSLQFKKPHKPAVKLIIEPNAVDLKPGQSQRFEAKLFDKHGNPTSGEVEWSVAPEGVGQFWDDGMFTATADTDATGFITATCGDLVGYACVHVITENPVPRSINICRTEGDDPRNISFKDDDQYCIQLGYDALFTAEIYDQFGEKYPLQHDMRWATNNRDVIDILYEDPETCRLFPKMKGKCTLTVIYEGLVDSIEIEVSNKCGSDTP